MSRGNLGALHLADGLVVSDSWFSPGEGPFTVLAKLAIANVLDAKRICRVFGVRPSQRPEATPHGRSLLHLEWLARSRSAPQLAASLWKRGLLSQSERWGRAVASDRALRYCPTCLSMGYQSVICQVEGLARCPQHNDWLLDHCSACNAPTPRYAVTAEAFDEPLICGHCRTAYAPIWGPAGGGQFRTRMGDEGAYLRLGRWFARADALDVQWPDQVGWLADPRAPAQAVEANKRVHMLGTLTSVAPLSEQAACCHSDLWTGTWALSSSSPQAYSASGATRDELTQARVAIYKSIRRHHARRFGVKVEAHIAGGSQQMVLSSHGMVMPCNEHVDPARHGFLAWRLRFESSASGQGSSSRLSLFQVLLLWPVDWSASDAAWGQFAYRCLLLDIDAARELNKALKGLDYDRPEDFPAWLEVVGLWCHRFGSQTRPWPDGLSALRLPGAAGKPGDLYLIAARSAAFDQGTTHEC
ncbi:hypothetical protein [Roseateles sp.]|uniref:hypothetical protein n=1 Tax=Roseateles sp. TaxID=1971397 RepID=UPI0039EA1D4C